MNVFGTAAAESLRHVENNIMHAGMTRVAMLISDHERVIEPLAQALDDCDSLARDIIDHVGFLRSNPQPVNRDRSTPRKKNMSSRGFAMVIDDENDDDGDEDDGGALVENDQVLAELMGYLGEAVDMFKKMADVSYRIKVQKSVVEGIRENISWRRNPDGRRFIVHHLDYYFFGDTHTLLQNPFSLHVLLHHPRHTSPDDARFY